MEAQVKKTDREEFHPQIFTKLTQDGDCTYLEAYEDKVDAADQHGSTGGLVATYALVKVERLRVDRTAKLVKAPKVAGS